MEIQNGSPLGLFYFLEIEKNHNVRSLSCEECEESLPHYVRWRNLNHTVLYVGAHYHDGTSIDHYDNVVAYTEYAL